MYRMSLMALIADDLPGVNRCIKIAIVHDIAEAIVGDITPSDGVPKEEKSRMEQEALDEMCKVLGDGMTASELFCWSCCPGNERWAMRMREELKRPWWIGQIHF
ncbi:hypothetical protein CASFOL_042281 [Castilleja foliolosa]|uniref:HD domain-containing protein n=1 Tax=Castilleja foliolosa TaxID=1961234 RepID=A0ABD3BBE8_9LAMI